nr:MBL fold metallo-hydrolase [Pandoraea captiosa]
MVDGIYQVRNVDLANITFVRGKTGWIVIDPLTAVETAKASLDLVNSKVENLPVTGVIFTHSHVDHFGGVRGVVDEKDVRSGKVPLVAPEGFMEESVSENVFAGTVMSRRASYMYGNLLPKNPKGNVGGGQVLCIQRRLPGYETEVRADGEERRDELQQGRGAAKGRCQYQPESGGARRYRAWKIAAWQSRGQRPG